MKNIGFIILLIALLSFNVSKIIEVRRLRGELIEFSFLYNDQFEKANINFEFEQKREGITINDSIYIIDAQSNVSTLSDFINSNGSSIFLRLDVSYCNACNDAITLYLIELADKLSIQNLYVLSNYRNGKYLRMMEEKYRNRVKFLYCENLEIDLNQKQQPFIFCLDSTFIARNVYVPDQQKSNCDKIYLKYACNK